MEGGVILVSLNIRNTARYALIPVSDSVVCPIGCGLYAALPWHPPTLPTMRFGLAPTWELDDTAGSFTWSGHQENSILHDNFSGEVSLSGVTEISALSGPIGSILGKYCVQAPLVRINGWSQFGLPVGTDILAQNNRHRIAIIPCESNSECEVAVCIWHRGDRKTDWRWWSVVALIRETGRYYTQPGGVSDTGPPYNSTPWDFAFETYWTPEDCAKLGGPNGYAVEHYASVRYSRIPTVVECQSHLSKLAEVIRGSFAFDSDRDTFGELTAEAVSALRATDANLLTTSRESVAMADGMRDLVALFASAGRPRTFVKGLQSLLNLRLSLKWGAPLTYQDLQKIGTEIGEYVSSYENRPAAIVARSRCQQHSEGSGPFAGYRATRLCTLKLILRPKAGAMTTDIIRKCWEFNFGSLESLWDAIPYSFCVDWILRIQDVLRDVDSFNALTGYFDVEGSVIGDKWEVDVPTPVLNRLGIPWQGTLKCTLYKRLANPLYYPLPTIRVKRGKFGQTQQFDALSLVIQRL